MIDLTLLREHSEKIIPLIKKKDPEFNVHRLIKLDKLVRSIRLEVEDLRHQKNELAKKAKTGITDQLRNQSIEIGKKLNEKEHELKKGETEFRHLYLTVPNIPSDDVPAGGKESNKILKVVGKKPNYSFPIRNHLELATAIGWIDFDAAVKTTGSQFALYKGDAVKLLYSLAMFMLKNNIKHGYEPILPPYVVNEKSLTVTGNFPKFKEDVYAINDEDLFLTPTAEVNLANIYRDYIFEIEKLPVRMTAWTSCFRREAGGYGATERGLIRMHQFEKVELFTICKPEDAQSEQERMLNSAEDILEQLGLHYRISLLAAQDCSFPSAKTFDIEAWLPGQEEYYEVSSVSNCTDFQSRRGLIRYRKESNAKPELVYTLNGSSLALSRLMVALIETYQQKDGSIIIPEVLKKQGFFE